MHNVDDEKEEIMKEEGDVLPFLTDEHGQKIASLLSRFRGLWNSDPSARVLIYLV